MIYNMELLNKQLNNHTHMPFIMTEENKFLFCQFVQDRWKISWWDGVNNINRINTYIDNIDTYECSPVCIKKNNLYYISFVTAGPCPGIDQYVTILKQCCTKDINDLSNTQIIQIGAQTGFVYLDKIIVYSYNNEYIHIINRYKHKELEYKLILNNESYLNKYTIARITYINNDPNALLISLVRYSDRYCKTIYFNVETGEQYCVKLEDKKTDVYKCFIDMKEHVLYHTLRNGTGHENRKIVAVTKYYFVPIKAIKQIK